jgi:hypothetical protein
MRAIDKPSNPSLLYDQQEFERRRHWQTSPVYDAVREGQVLYERLA